MTAAPFRTREQRYAECVYTKVDAVLQLVKTNEWDKAKKQAYGSLAHRLPVLIRTAGLAQSLAFVQARNKENTPQRQLLQDVEAVLQETGVLEQNQHLVVRSRTAGFDDYLRLTEATLESLLWFKRFAQSELNVEQGEQGQEVAYAAG